MKAAVLIAVGSLAIIRSAGSIFTMRRGQIEQSDRMEALAIGYAILGVLIGALL